MGERTGISWCHHTFNPWWGCVEVSPACDHCYARGDAKRYGHDVWGKDAPRRFFGEGHWNGPLRWNRAAEAAGERRRVFCASMADLGEERNDDVGLALDSQRRRLWSLIASTPWLDWLLLTKRPRLYRRLIPADILALPNVWPGVTVESQDYGWRIEELLQAECTGPRWVSHEPALGPLDFSHDTEVGPLTWLRRYALGTEILERIDWVVTGCESRGLGLGRVDGYLDIERSVRGQCRAAGVAYFHKQMPLGNRVSKVPAEWPEERRVQAFPR